MVRPVKRDGATGDLFGSGPWPGGPARPGPWRRSPGHARLGRGEWSGELVPPVSAEEAARVRSGTARLIAEAEEREREAKARSRVFVSAALSAAERADLVAFGQCFRKREDDIGFGRLADVTF